LRAALPQLAAALIFGCNARKGGRDNSCCPPNGSTILASKAVCHSRIQPKLDLELRSVDLHWLGQRFIILLRPISSLEEAALSNGLSMFRYGR